MGLNGNRSRLNFGCNKPWGIAPALTEGGRRQSERANWIRQCCATTVLSKSAKPTGYYAPAVYQMPLTAGELGTSAFGIYSAGSITLGMSGGVNGVAPLTGSGDITNAAMGLIVSAVASLSGSGDITNADVIAAAQAVASLSGSGDLTAAMSAYGLLVASLVGSGDLAAVIHALGVLEADIVVSGDALTTSNVAGAVLAGIVEGTLSLGDVQRILLAISVGKTIIVTGPPVHAQFRDQADTKDRVDAEMSGSERVSVTLDPS